MEKSVCLALFLGYGRVASDAPFVMEYRRCFTQETTANELIHLTADNRYIMILNGAIIARGSERGDAEHWFYESYQLKLTAGQHDLRFLVWWLGDRAPTAQQSVRHGLLVAPESETAQKAFGTGIGRWQARCLPGHQFDVGRVVGPQEIIDARSVLIIGSPAGT